MKAQNAVLVGGSQVWIFNENEIFSIIYTRMLRKFWPFLRLSFLFLLFFFCAFKIYLRKLQWIRMNFISLVESSVKFTILQGVEIINNLRKGVSRHILRVQFLLQLSLQPRTKSNKLFFIGGVRVFYRFLLFVYIPFGLANRLI